MNKPSIQLAVCGPVARGASEAVKSRKISEVFRKPPFEDAPLPE